MKGLLSLFPTALPVTCQEVRDLAVRHVVSDPRDAGAAAITGALLAIYASLWKRENPETPMRAVSEEDAYQLLRRYFVEGYLRRHPTSAEDAAARFLWPEAIPRRHPAYPREFLVRVAVSYGLAAGGLASVEREALAN